ncbi:recombinase family protein [Aminobacter sp. SS-2016]|uniref:recombinase family protein n=1 Tax=Aminobacter sp. Y103A TaxID=1870862 RepID=UPI0025743E08|nr:recombinase family protein [Aminobacter sp. SS-2016]
MAGISKGGHPTSGPCSPEGRVPRPVTRLSCAVYTRKSTEDGLDQEFNSLDAQREACASFIASQVGLGWKLIPDHYDDGGISGGTMERPALLRLLQDIRDRKVDVVVVYKIDRLTRSLADFAKIVEVFDGNGVSFVSVTQQFNTTTSMGRLTLNVLLSFAQFEREVTAERIRDKIAASKQKGIWMGGTVPLGYLVEDRKLLINEAEASFVRSLFSRYLDVRSVPKLARQVSLEAAAFARGMCSAEDVNMPSIGRDTEKLGIAEGCARYHRRPMTSGMLYKLLSNPLYIGKVRHKGNVYDGEHEAIIDIELFQAVQRQLAIGAAVPRGSNPNADTHLLTGILFDDTGDRMAPTHSRRHGKRYRYYVSGRVRRSADAVPDSWRIPAEEIERVVCNHVTQMLADRALIAGWIQQYASVDLIETGLDRAASLGASLADHLPSDQRRATLHLLLRTVTLMPSAIRFEVDAKQAVRVLVAGNELLDGDDDRSADHDDDQVDLVPETATIEVPISLKRRGVGMRIVVDSPYAPPPEPDAALVDVIARAHVFLDHLTNSSDMSSGGIAAAFGIDRADVGRILPLAFLSPPMLDAIFNGNQPASLSARRLARMELPMLWADQQAALQ